MRLLLTLRDRAKLRPIVRCRFVRSRLAATLGLPVAWLPMTASPLATDAARIVSKLDAWGRVA